MKNKLIYESPELELLTLDVTDLLEGSPSDEEEYNGKIELPWEKI